MHYTRLFGFGELTGIDLPGEEEGILFNAEDMRDSDIATTAIGQSIAVTPLQLVTAMSSIANGGTLMRPVYRAHNQKSRWIGLRRARPAGDPDNAPAHGRPHADRPLGTGGCGRRRFKGCGQGLPHCGKDRHGAEDPPRDLGLS